ncbi:hypothetical protein BJ684DRAFT_18111 [Piptocephalis cylindrospora]|uniref:Secreted protein n=1 Tax=Piptocephalis cylindrospora TaxID=1907219 RepID=A0A4P9XXZ3_9FUNG|nr:hypothetical protein BJ684DRAFT_18111 [Piptocephalis cylindrospora]|eukprot:RKP11276.1 hypothetical protein BJ684DRAFT_18111 [Piptocephalis cylindrospora]
MLWFNAPSSLAVISMTSMALSWMPLSSASPFFDMRHRETFKCTGLDESVNPILHDAFSALSLRSASNFCTRLGPRSQPKVVGKVGPSHWRSWRCQDGPDASETICALDKVLDHLAHLEPYAGYTLAATLSL